MTRSMVSLALALVFAGAACVGLNVGDSDGCAEACERAASCGFLPSALGWSEEDSLAAVTADCVRRCVNSPRSDPTAKKLLACLQGEQTSTAWCSDTEAEQYPRWQGCAGLAACIDEVGDRQALRGEASLSVSLISFTDFENDFAGDSDTSADAGALTIKDVFAARAADGSVTACRAALCSASLCDESEDDRPCDDTLCHQPPPTAAQMCDKDKLAIERIILVASQSEAMQVRTIMYDAEGEAEKSCGMSTTATLAAIDYALSSGPLQLAVQIVGELPAAELKRIAYAGAAEVFADDPAATMRYCLVFPGPAVILRAGANEALIPVGDISELIAAGISAPMLGTCPK